MVKKSYRRIFISFILLFSSLLFTVRAFASEDIIGDKMPDESTEIFRENGDEISPPIKESYSVPIKEFDLGMVEGGNLDAINPLATKQNIAKADIVENVGEAGEEFEIFIEQDEENQGTIKQTRQFVSFTSKSGKTFHLIIDHEKTSQNVSLLTEVGEQDLLNMIEGEEPSQHKPVEIEKPKLEEKVEEPIVEESKKKGFLSLPVILIIAIVVGAGGYYIKIYKPSLEDYDDEFNEDEYEYDEEEYAEEFDEEIEEMDEEENIDEEGEGL